MTEPNDHLTIEQRLTRLEANQRTILDNQAMHGAAIREIVEKLAVKGLWIRGLVAKGNDHD
jgi:hypothetical protein